jgi:hypothetical protein
VANQLVHKVDPSQKVLKKAKIEHPSSTEDEEATGDDMDFIEDDDVDYYEGEEKHFFPFYYKIVRSAKAVYIIFPKLYESWVPQCTFTTHEITVHFTVPALTYNDWVGQQKDLPIPIESDLQGLWDLQKLSQETKICTTIQLPFEIVDNTNFIHKTITKDFTTYYVPLLHVATKREI